MGKIDELLIKEGMKKFGLTREQIIKEMNQLVEIGFIKKGLDNFHITEKGIKYYEREELGIRD